MLMYWFANNLFNPILRTILRSPFRFLLPDNWVILTYTGRKTHKKRSLVFHVTQYKDEHGDRVGITAETTEERFNELVTAAAKTYPIVAIKPQSSVSGS